MPLLLSGYLLCTWILFRNLKSSKDGILLTCSGEEERHEWGEGELWLPAFAGVAEGTFCRVNGKGRRG